jgi:membrane protein required for colicin V production
LTLFDIAAVALLVLSGFAGWARGGVREMVSVVSLTLALVVAAYALPFSGPFFRIFIHPAWAGSVAAMIGVFVLAYIVIRLAGNLISEQLARSTALGAADRMIGLGFGLVRAMVGLGLFVLVFNAVTPADLRPDWILRAKLYPAAHVSSIILKAMAPHGLALGKGLSEDLAGKVKAQMRGDDAAQEPPRTNDPDPSDDKASTVSSKMRLDNAPTPGEPGPRRKRRPSSYVTEQQP